MEEVKPELAALAKEIYERVLEAVPEDSHGLELIALYQLIFFTMGGVLTDDVGSALLLRNDCHYVDIMKILTKAFPADHAFWSWVTIH